MADKIYTVKANDSLMPGINASYIFVKQMTAGATLRAIGSGKGGSFDYTIGKGSKIGPTPFDITELELINDSGTDIDIELRVGRVFYDENILSGDVSVLGGQLTPPGVIDDLTDVTIGIGTTSILAENLDRNEAIITASAANTMTARIGGVNAGVARGVLLPPGGSVILTTTAEIYAYSSAAGQVFTRSWTEF